MKSIKSSKINGKIIAPSSKSMMQRAVAASMLAGGDNIIKNPSLCDDAVAAINIVKKFSRGIKKNFTIDCNESGLCVRLFSVISALYDEPITISGRGTLLTRDVSMVENALKQLGVECSTNNGKLPIEITGPINAGRVSIDCSVTSQLLTGLLMVLPLCDGDSYIETLNLKSKPYVDMTIALLNDFGIMIENKNYKEFIVRGNQEYNPVDYTVEGDWSGASFMLVAGAVCGKIVVTNLSYKSLQADKVIVDALKMAGASVKINKDSVEVQKVGELKGFEFDASECPDLFPPLVVLAVNAVGKSIIKGTERLKFKESDRVFSLLSEFKKIGAEIEHIDNSFVVSGKGYLQGGNVNSHDDHRIVMACAIAGLNSKKGVNITDNWQCVSKSYPDFFTELEKLI